MWILEIGPFCFLCPLLKSAITAAGARHSSAAWQPATIPTLAIFCKTTVRTIPVQTPSRMKLWIWSGKAVNFTTGVNKSDEAAPRCRVYSDLFLSHFIGGSSLPSNLLLNRFCVLGFNGLSPLQGLLSLQKKTSRARS